MRFVKHETMKVQCSECGAHHESDNISDFKESNTMPPYVYFMCSQCKMLSKLNSSTMPQRVFATLVSRIAAERGHRCDQQLFDKMQTVEC